ncbi:uncharacterized protein LOC123551031 [Mercenaria mercenaria]|uniref:uncharacterized protein LOC123551031 n=1 Tax=Mercenaria mercenaria TaxID=6596 RepID=UPI00234E557A|nr:uncharacterized protein LOC123551031 [Mercenaria mercenaria]
MLIFLHESASSDVHIYVSPQGSDQSQGQSISTPIKTLKRAMDLANQTSNSSSVVYIELMQGYYDLDHTLVVSRDKLVIRAYNDQEVHVTGGQRVPSALFKTVTDPAVLSRLPAKSHANVRVAHLPDIGITDYGKMSTRGGWARTAMPMEVSFNGEPLHIAQWPDEGFINIVNVPDGKDGLRFQYNSSIPQSWNNETDPWVYGYWFRSWLDILAKVKSLNATSETVTLAERISHGVKIGHWNDLHADQGGYFRFVNILSALDQPGEYYVDRDHGNIYVWLPNDDGNAKVSDVIYVSMIDTCIQINRDVRQIILEGFTLEACRGNGIYGTNVHNIQLTKLAIRNTGKRKLKYY